MSSPPNQIAAIVLAAGKGTRMKSKTPKVLHPLAGSPVISYPLTTLKKISVKKIVIVESPDRVIQNALKAQLSSEVEYVVQDPPLGTGHAVLKGLPALGQFAGSVLIMYGDVPLIQETTLKKLIRVHQKQKAVLSFATAKLNHSPPYGRILRDGQGKVVKIIESGEILKAQSHINEFNVGLYLIEASFLKKNLKKLSSSNKQQEYYLTDLIEWAARARQTIATIDIDDELEWQGINNQLDLARVEKRILQDRCARWQIEGVRMYNPDQIYLDETVKLASDVVLFGPCRLEGNTVVGEDSVVEMGNQINDSIIGKNSHIKAHSVIENSVIGNDCQVGPFAHLRPGSALADHVKIGNFVELKKTRMGQNSKASHLSYLGDAEVGRDVNIGCGTITCNYDGYNKFKTIIEEGVFIGSDSQLVAPVTIGKNAFVGAGSTITKNVTNGALVVSRAEQREFEGWSEKFKARSEKKK